MAAESGEKSRRDLKLYSARGRVLISKAQGALGSSEREGLIRTPVDMLAFPRGKKSENSYEDVLEGDARGPKCRSETLWEMD